MWGGPSYRIPKKDQTVRFISDVRKVNKCIVRKPFPIPKISTVLQQFEDFTLATALDLNMDFIPLDWIHMLSKSVPLYLGVGSTVTSGYQWV